MTVNFALLAMDQIVNHAAAIPYMFNGQVRVPMVIRMPGGGGHQLGPTHSHSFEAMFLQIPGLLVACPSTPADGKGLLKAAIRDDNPVIFIEHETLYGVARRGTRRRSTTRIVNFGEAAIRREGGDVTIVGILRMADVAQQAAKTLANEHGVEAEVIDPRTLRPLDLDTILESVAQDEPRGDRRGGLAPRRRRRQPRRADRGAGLRLPRRADPAGHRRRRPDALLEAARAGGDPARRARRQRGAGDARGSGHDGAEIVMPRLSDSMEEGTVLRWLKSAGDEVALGDELVEIETDKANMVYEADAAGTLIEIVADGGRHAADRRGDRAGRRGRARRPVGRRRDGAATRGVRSLRRRPSASAASRPGPRRSRSTPAAEAARARRRRAAGGDGRVKASPIARRIAERERASTSRRSQGSGPGRPDRQGGRRAGDRPGPAAVRARRQPLRRRRRPGAGERPETAKGAGRGRRS